MKSLFIFNWYQFCSSSQFEAEQNYSVGHIKTTYFWLESVKALRVQRSFYFTELTFL